MVFTTTLFTYFFFPSALILWMIGKKVDRRKPAWHIADWILIILGIQFFSWTNYEMILWIIVFIISVYMIGLLLEQTVQNQNPKLTKSILTTGIILLLVLLGYYKYYRFTIHSLNTLFQWNIVLGKIASPLGISFLTFTAISYFSDIAKGSEKAGSFRECALYLTFFPKVVSGPIVLWKDFRKQIATRTINSDQWVKGIKRISIGYAKKIILADTFGIAILQIDTAFSGKGIDSPTAWLAVILYWLQIYYDFSGYSDIALGLSELFGFHFEENFHFPYISKSISEFWRRWHISLGNWFKEYVYFPLGGSRCSKARTILNLAIVWALTGIWHGAGGNYLLWGIINGGFVILDHCMKNNRIWKKIPSFIMWFFTTVISICFWELFRFSTVKEAFAWIKVMFGKTVFVGYTFTWRYYLTASLCFFVITGILGATLLGTKRVQNYIERLKNKQWFYLLEGIIAILLFIITVSFMINSTYSPFIYFQY